MPQYEPLESERHPDVKFLGQLRNLDLYIDTRQPGTAGRIFEGN